METVEESSELSQYLTFRVADEEYGVGVLRVKEIIRYDELTRLPGAPSSIRGVINLRGAVVPVVDLAVKFGLPETKVTKLTCVVIVEIESHGESTVMGLMTDAVDQVCDFKPGEIEAVPAFGTGVRMEYLQGMAKTGKRFTLILDIERLVSGEEKQAAQELTQESPAG